MRFALLLAALLPLSLAAQEPVRPISPALAAKKVNQKVVVQMEVKSTGGNTARYLNSAADFRDASNFAIYVPSANVEKFRQTIMQDPAVYYKGKMIVVTGVVTLDREKPQIKAENPSQIKVVGNDDSPASPKARQPARQ
jgi:DNA/RNA endonuclease YhcR with UshA esterase domain